MQVQVQGAAQRGRFLHAQPLPARQTATTARQARTWPCHLAHTRRVLATCAQNLAATLVQLSHIGSSPAAHTLPAVAQTHPTPSRHCCMSVARPLPGQQEQGTLRSPSLRTQNPSRAGEYMNATTPRKRGAWTARVMRRPRAGPVIWPAEPRKVERALPSCPRNEAAAPATAARCQAPAGGCLAGAVAPPPITGSVVRLVLHQQGQLPPPASSLTGRI